MAVVYAARHTPLATLLHTDGPSLAALHVPWGGAAATALASAGLAAAVAVNFARHASSREPHELLRSVGTAAAGATFATGLGLSGMTNPDKVRTDCAPARACARACRRARAPGRCSASSTWRRRSTRCTAGTPVSRWCWAAPWASTCSSSRACCDGPRRCSPRASSCPRPRAWTASCCWGRRCSARAGAWWASAPGPLSSASRREPVRARAAACVRPAALRHACLLRAVMFWAFTPAMFAGFRLAEATIAATPPTAAPAEGHAQEPPARS